MGELSMNNDKKDKSSLLGKLAVPAIIVASIGIPLYFAFPTFADLINQDSLRTEGIEAQAVVLSVEQTRSRVNENWIFEVQLEVSPEDAPPYQVTVSQAFEILHVSLLQPGVQATIRYDQDDRRKVVITSLGGPPPNLEPAVAPPSPAHQDAPENNGPEITHEPAGIDPVCMAATKCCIRASGVAKARACASYVQGGVAPTACAAALATYQGVAKKNGTSCD